MNRIRCDTCYIKFNDSSILPRLSFYHITSDSCCNWIRSRFDELQQSFPLDNTYHCGFCGDAVFGDWQILMREVMCDLRSVSVDEEWEKLNKTDSPSVLKSSSLSVRCHSPSVKMRVKCGSPSVSDKCPTPSVKCGFPSVKMHVKCGSLDVLKSTSVSVKCPSPSVKCGSPSVKMRVKCGSPSILKSNSLSVRCPSPSVKCGSPSTKMRVKCGSPSVFKSNSLSVKCPSPSVDCGSSVKKPVPYGSPLILKSSSMHVKCPSQGVKCVSPSVKILGKCGTPGRRKRDKWEIDEEVVQVNPVDSGIIVDDATTPPHHITETNPNRDKLGFPGRSRQERWEFEKLSASLRSNSLDLKWEGVVKTEENFVDSVLLADEEPIDRRGSTVTLPLELSGGARDYSSGSSSSVSEDEPKCTHEDRKAPLDCEFLNIECQFGKYFSEIQNRAIESGLDITPKNKKSMKKLINLRRDEHVEMFTNSKANKVAKCMGDGNCGFRACSICITGDENQHKQLRKMAVDELNQNWNKYKKRLDFTHTKDQCSGFLCPDQMKTTSHRGTIMHSLTSMGKFLVYNKTEYIEGMSKLKTYCTDTELVALSTKLQVDINSISVVGPIEAVNCCQVSPISGFYDKNKEPLAIVLLNKHEHFEPIFNVKALESEEFSCSPCGQSFNAESAQIKHKKTDHQFPCGFCDYKFNNNFEKEDHQNKNHNNSGILQDECVCDQCEMTFSRVSNYLRHIQTPHKEFCSKCRLKFLTAANLKVHQKEHLHKKKAKHSKPNFTKFKLHEHDENNDLNGNNSHCSPENSTVNSSSGKRKRKDDSDNEGSAQSGNEKPDGKFQLDEKEVQETNEISNNDHGDNFEEVGTPSRKHSRIIYSDSESDESIQTQVEGKQNIEVPAEESKDEISVDSKKHVQFDILENEDVLGSELDESNNENKDELDSELGESNKCNRDDENETSNNAGDSDVPILSTPNNVSGKGKIKKKRKREKSGCRVQSKWFTDQSPIDSNGEHINSYIIPVHGTDTRVFCGSCNTDIDVTHSGISQITKNHSDGVRHKRRREELKSQGAIGSFVQKSSKVHDLEIGLSIFANTHDITFNALPCLVRILKNRVPESLTIQQLSLGREKATYGTRYALAKTEEDKLAGILRSTPFAASMDGLVKGRKKRVTYICRYFDRNLKKVVVRFLTQKTTPVESGENVAEGFLDYMILIEVDIEEQLVQIHSDSAMVLRGEKKGAIKLISEKAPIVKVSDLGGDLLHHLNNAVKTVFTLVFPEVIEFLNDTKYEITFSPGKEDAYLKCCIETGCNPTRLVSWQLHRFLDRFGAVDDRDKHFPALASFISKAKTRSENRMSSTSDSEDSEVDEEDLAHIQRKKRKETEKKKQGRLRRLKEATGKDGRAETQLLLTLSKTCLRPTYELLKSFQSNSPLVHLLYPESKRIFKETVLEVVEPKFLKTSSGKNLSDEELRTLVFETDSERETRKREDKKQKKEGTRERHATLKDASEVLLPEAVNDKIVELTESENLHPIDVENLKQISKERIFMYKKMLTLDFQHHLHFDLAFTKALQCLCPSRIDKSESAEDIVFLASRLSNLVKPTQLDDLKRDWNLLVDDKCVFNEKYEEYIEQVSDDKVSKFQRERIDEVWAPVISNPKFKILPRLLEGLLSLFHSTAATEGSVNNIRNTLKDRSHNLIDENLNARNFVKSTVKASSSKCCHDFSYDTKEHRHNWNNASELRRRNLNHGETAKEDESDFSDEINQKKTVGDSKTKNISSCKVKDDVNSKVKVAGNSKISYDDKAAGKKKNAGNSKMKNAGNSKMKNTGNSKIKDAGNSKMKDAGNSKKTNTGKSKTKEKFVDEKIETSDIDEPAGLDSDEFELPDPADPVKKNISEDYKIPKIKKTQPTKKSDLGSSQNKEKSLKSKQPKISSLFSFKPKMN